MTNTVSLLVLTIIMLPMIISTVVALLLLRRHRRGKRSPLTADLLRSPGESLRKQVETLSENIDDYAWNMIFSAFVPIILLQLLIAFGDKRAIGWYLGVSLLVYVTIIIWQSRRLYSLFLKSQTLRLGLDAEMAVGQELNLLMLHGCRVFHDFPAKGFNIDHIVIGAGGVIAIETKGRAKPDQGRGSVEAKVIFNGKVLRFPNWLEKNPVIQARRQAKWLQKWVSDAVGQTVVVRPALALPGWFVERTNPSDVMVFNGKSPIFLANPKATGIALSPEMIQRIIYQIEQRCRNVEPSAYVKKPAG